MSFNSTKNSSKDNISAARRRNQRRSTIFLLCFLLFSFGLIFCTATYGIQRSDQTWLQLDQAGLISANYGVDALAEQSRPARDVGIIGDKQDDDSVISQPATPTPTPEVETLATSTPTPTATPLINLQVDIGGPYSGNEGERIFLNVESSSLIQVINSITYEWDLDNDGQFDDEVGASVSTRFVDEGDYPIRVRASDLLGRISIDTTSVIIENVAPLVDMGLDLEINEAEEISLAATVKDPGVEDTLTYRWDFGDGTPPIFNTLTPKHTYVDNGDFAVRLRVDDNDGGVTEETILVLVENLPPVVEAGADQNVNEGQTILVAGTAIDPAGDFDTLTYFWDFDFKQNNFTPDAIGPTASVYLGNGPKDYRVALLVQDEDGGEAIDTLRVRVGNVAPTITAISSSGQHLEASTVAVNVVATDVGSDTLTYAFDWENDGNFDVQGAPASVTNVWEDNGLYTMRIRVDDGDGGQVFQTQVISIANVPPRAVANGPPGSIVEGDTATFNGTDSSDVGKLDTLSYVWNFGDGEPPVPGVSASHLFGDNGVYSTTLTVTDKDGGVSNTSLAVTVLNANPTAVIVGGSNITVNEGQSISTLSATATDPGTADTFTYAWDFNYDPANPAFTEDDLNNPSGPSPIYPDGPNTSFVAVRVRDDDYNALANPAEIGEDIETLQVTVLNQPPSVDAGGPYSGIEGQLINFTGVATDVVLDFPLTYQWDLFNDGVINATGTSITASLPAEGIYNVTLRVIDKDGGIGFGSTTVEIKNAPPTANIGGPYTGNENSPITVDASLSTDPTNDPLTYTWDFGDGTPITSTTSLTIPHTYIQDGIYTLILTVDDGRGGTDTTNTSVTINNLPPTALAQLNPPLPGPYFESTNNAINFITFNGSGSTDPGPSDILSYSWNFGDGSPLAPLQTVNHIYADDGTYNVTLQVQDDFGAITTTNLSLSVLNLPPTAVAALLTGGPLVEGSLLEFDAGGSTDPGADTLNFTWDFGDGSPVVNTINITAGHQFVDEGNFNVTLTADDGDGGVDTDNSLNVTVLNANPTAVATTTTVAPYQEGVPVVFDHSLTTDPGVNDTLTYTWNFGDGSLITNTTNITLPHTYANQGTYAAVITVTDGDGGIDTDFITVTVQNVAPIANANGPYTTTVGIPVLLTSSGVDVPADTLTFAWDLDNNGTYETAGQNVNFTSLVTGTFTVVVDVNDGDGGIGTDTTTVQVNSLGPIAWLGVGYYLRRWLRRRRHKRKHQKHYIIRNTVFTNEHLFNLTRNGNDQVASSKVAGRING